MTTTSAALGEVGTFIAGSGFPLHLQGQTGGSYPFAKVGDISRCARAGRQELGDADHWVDDDIVSQLKAKIIPARAILFAKIGEAIQQNFRVIASRPMLVDNNAMAYVAADDRLDHRYAFHFLKSIDMYRLASSTTVPSLRKSTLEEIVVPLPPLPEQRRIAAILDKADALRAKRREAIAKLDQLLQSVFLDMFGDPVTNPKGWPCTALRQVTTKIGSGATPTGGDESYQDSGISLIRSLNVHDGQFRWAKLAFIDDDQAHKLRNVVVEADDVLLNITGASVARVCRAPTKVLPARVNQHVSIIRCGRQIAPQYLEHALMSPSMKGKLLGAAESGATRQAITKAEIERLELPLPPIEIQSRFSAIVGRIARQQELFGAERKRIESMFAALQDRSFSGTV